ncbi:MAG: hypothetical protein QG639_570 [Patescibacteria group bacterium]|jgi:hypothetical protein|nr:hypothetical protein [Patescibacteria group bacterium]
MSEIRDWGNEPPKESKEISANSRAQARISPQEMSRIAALMRGEKPDQNEEAALEQFSFQEQTLRSEYLEAMDVKPGVRCDVYIHPDTKERDLGIITIEPGAKTPLQRVLKGDLTIEGYLKGEGTLTLTHTDGTQSIFEVDSSANGFCFSVEVGETMQWQASEGSELRVFEVCFPPYEDGRFENLPE